MKKSFSQRRRGRAVYSLCDWLNEVRISPVQFMAYCPCRNESNFIQRNNSYGIRSN